MKGFVPTPQPIVDLMVEKLFSGANPKNNDIILDPGCGTGAFIEGIIRWCNTHSVNIPKVVGIDSDPKHISVIGEKFKNFPSIEIRNEDFLLGELELFDYIIGNPPYVPITKLSEPEKESFKRIFETAKSRFDLYLLFFEQGLKHLKSDGKLVFITPEKYLYVKSASTLRKILSRKQIIEIQMIHENSFGDLTTYPTITTVLNSLPNCPTKFVLRDGIVKFLEIPTNGDSWLPTINGNNHVSKGITLKDLSIRISCGVATGADSVFIHKTKDLNPNLRDFSYPTISGRQLTPVKEIPKSTDSMIIPYSKTGDLIPEHRLGFLENYLSKPSIRSKLLKRTCVTRKPWYAFHENPPLIDILKPKILCKDITAKPHFWLDKEGSIVPRHSVYYIVPKNPNQIEKICDYLNSDDVRHWLEANCQRAASGFLRLQSSIIKLIPIPNTLLDSSHFFVSKI